MIVRLTLLRGLGLLEVGGEGWVEGDLGKLSPREMLLPAAQNRMSNPEAFRHRRSVLNSGASAAADRGQLAGDEGNG